MNIVTWNMQGSNSTTENKWNSGVQPLLKSMKPSPVACLQECGGVPESAVLIDTLNFSLGGGAVDTVQIYAWGGSQTRPGYYIYFHNWDTGGNRVNTALVSDSLPMNLGDSVVLISPQGMKVWRPALGVKFNDTWVFSFHAISPGGPDGAGLLAAVAANFDTWIVAADWNRQPDTLVVPDESVICPPDQNTYSLKDPIVKYDYSVCSGDDAVTGTVATSIVMSDHFPVMFSL